jgi:hypothetical protein
VKRFFKLFMEYGLMWALLVWAAAVAMMAINTPDPVWRWSFLALSAAGLVLVVVINWVRKKLLTMAQVSKEGTDS